MNKLSISSLIALVALCATAPAAKAQYPVLLHSHNDYTRTVPFYEAYSQHIYSIECDMFYQNGEFLVGHDAVDLRPELTFDRLYLQPLVSLYKLNGGKPYANSDSPIQLMVEVKSNNTNDYMAAFVEKLKQYPEVFDPEVNPNACRIVVTGQYEPKPEDFNKYPTYITFDGDINRAYTPEQLQRVAMFSVNFGAYSIWNGKGTIIAAENEKVKQLISKAHSMGKPIRFWGAPESLTAWNTFYTMGIDYINTDAPAQCAEFFSNWKSKNYVITNQAQAPATHAVIRNDRLDKITRNFSGFQDDKMQLTERQPIYTPTYRNDGTNKPVKNVILLIGDGMGLTQVVATERINDGLTMMLIKYFGISQTSSADAYTTDSAAGGSALATGVATNNRHISANADGTPNPSLSDFFCARGKKVGVVSLGNAVDATPAAFFAHNTERDSSDAITRDLLNSPITLLAGSGMREFTQRNDGIDMIAALQSKGFSFVTSINDINANPGKTVCIDEEMGDAANVNNLDLLARTTKESITKLQTNNKNGFFLMVEGAKIDYAGHSRYFPGCVMETLSFDKAVAEALRFADSNGETLVIVTADHETGGLTLIDGDNNTGHTVGYYLTNDHTPMTVPVFAYGPQSQRFIGKQLNTDICKKIKEIFSK
ncbi:MAG: alkaline phosphatase [Muribaculaceae bacterium]